MLAVPHHFITSNDVTGNTTTGVIDRGRVVCCSDIFALLNPVLVGITRYPTVCLICARKIAEYIENQESRKAAARASY